MIKISISSQKKQLDDKVNILQAKYRLRYGDSFPPTGKSPHQTRIYFTCWSNVVNNLGKYNNDDSVNNNGVNDIT